MQKKPAPKAQLVPRKPKKPKARAPKRAEAVPALPAAAYAHVRPPRVSRSGNVTRVSGSTIVSSISFITDGSPHIASYNLNARNQTVFPWMYGVADMYDKAKFVSLEYSILTTMGMQAQGMVGLAYDPDPTDEPPGSLADMSRMHAEFQPTAVPERRLKIKTASLTPWLFNGTAATVDRLSSFGTLYVATEGVGAPDAPAGLNECGTLMCHFIAEFSHPEMTVTDSAISNTAGGAGTLGLHRAGLPKNSSLMYADVPRQSTNGRLPIEFVHADFATAPHTSTPHDVAAHIIQPGRHLIELELDVYGTPSASNQFTPGDVLNATGPDLEFWTGNGTGFRLASASDFIVLRKSYEWGINAAATFWTKMRATIEVITFVQQVWCKAFYAGTTLAAIGTTYAVTAYRGQPRALLTLDSVASRPADYVPDVIADRRQRILAQAFTQRAGSGAVRCDEVPDSPVSEDDTDYRGSSSRR